MADLKNAVTMGTNPLTGDRINGFEGLISNASGTVMLLGAVAGGAYVFNKIRDATGVSQEETSVQVI